jgi:glycerol-3-phosphate dehydrogenase (NAD(P)+)
MSSGSAGTLIRTNTPVLETLHVSEQATTSQSVAVIGDGQMGLVMADLLGANGHEVRIWGPFRDHLDELARSRCSPRLPGYRIPDSIVVSSDPDTVLAGAEIVVCAIPCQFIRPVFERLSGHITTTPVIVSVAKGIEVTTLMRPTEVIRATLGDAGRRGVCLSGPTIATELVARLIATMVAASEDLEAARLVQEAFNSSWIRVYTHEDLAGVEFAGAVKNVVAIAAGILDGLGQGFNAKSALLARGLAEIVRLGSALDARRETFFGIAGVGDLATTCFSPDGRNRSCGEAIGQGASLKEYLSSAQCVVEGVETTRAIVQLAQTHQVEVPIIDAVHSVLFEGVSPKTAIGGLLSRGVGSERVG